MAIIKNFKDAISLAKNIIITTHLYPDADGIGSEISLCMALKKINKNVICSNEEELLERYKYLDPENSVVGHDQVQEKFPLKPDLIIVVDTNTVYRIGEKMQAFAENSNVPILFIDHHPCPESVKKNNCIDTEAAATGQLVGELIESLGIDFDKNMALPLYTAILIDTSSFRYPTVTAKTHTMIGKLMQTGIKPTVAYNGIYGTKNIQHLHFLGKILSSANSNETEEVAWIVLKQNELDQFNTDIEDTHAFINHLLILDNIKVACMIRDDVDKVKISLRSTGEYDVGLIAMGLGGGGHSHSAATLIDKIEGQSLDRIIADSIAKIENLLASQTALKSK